MVLGGMAQGVSMLMELTLFQQNAILITVKRDNRKIPYFIKTARTYPTLPSNMPSST
jgi:hypothetical protein